MTAHDTAIALRNDLSALWAKAPAIVRLQLSAEVAAILRRADELVTMTELEEQPR
jgi:hypothetical protein